ncbi:MAG: ankyrin repeat domain-containing protein, partial [Pyrinomonadaceae bacterium]
IKTPSNNQWTLLHNAVSYSNKEAVELLIAKGADINAKNKDGKTPLQLAIDSKNKEIAELLKKHGAL